MTQVGLLMAVFSIAGLVLSFPTGFLLGKLGAKSTGGIAILLLVAGSLCGTYSTTFASLLASRTFEGAGMAIIGVIAPVMISSWFPARMRGLSLGIWSTWCSVGIFLVMNAAPRLLMVGNDWRKVWWFGSVAGAMSLVMFLSLYRNPASRVGAVVVGQEGEHFRKPPKGGFLAVLLTRDVWLLSISLAMFNILVMAMGTFLQPFLMKVHSLSGSTAGLYSSLSSVVMLVSCPLGGFLSDRLNVKKWIIAAGLMLLSSFWLIAFSAPVHYVPAIIVLFGILSGPVVTAIMSVVPDVVKRPELMGFGMATLMFSMNVGSFIGPVLFGQILDKTASWTAASYAMIPVCFIGAITACMMKTK